MKRLLCVLVCVYCLAGIAQADDMLPPDWRGDDRTVMAEWDSWIDFPNPSPPDYWESNPVGIAVPEATFAASTELLSGFEGRTDVLKLNEHDGVIFDLENHPGGDHKIVRIQVTSYMMDADISLDVWAWKDGVLLDGYTGERFWPEEVDTFWHPDDWTTYVYEFEIWPNPDREQIGLKFTDDAYQYGIYVDQVVIDTICIPEPATLIILAIGGMSLIRRRR